MTKTKKAIKEANKMADLEILKAQTKAKIQAVKDWLNVEVYGYKRKKIVIISAVFALIIISQF
jgi:hypothetical protein